MSDVSQGPGWWVASNGKWYAPHLHPSVRPQPPATPPPAVSPTSVPDFQTENQPGLWNAPSAIVPVSPRPASHELNTTDQLPLVSTTSGAPGMFTPRSDYATMFGAQRTLSKQRRRVPPLVAWIAAGVLLITAVALGIVSVHQTSSANDWRKADQKTTAQLSAAHSSISSLNTKVGSLNTQLAAQASAKEKAIDANTALTQLVNQESTVSGELNTCVSDLQDLISTVATDLEDGNYGDPTITEDADTSRTDCLQAQTDNQTLQSEISSASG